MSTPIRFYYQGAVREVSNAAPTQTILQHLREDLHCTGTKEGCAEGDPNGLDQPKMLSIGLHCRLVGRPGRAAALARFLDYVQGHEQVWITRRIDIARHWRQHHPCL